MEEKMFVREKEKRSGGGSAGKNGNERAHALRRDCNRVEEHYRASALVKSTPEG